MVIPSPEAVSEALSESDASVPSLLDSLVLAARHLGLHLSSYQLIHNHQLDSSELSVAKLLHIAADAGLRATCVSLKWRDVISLGNALPAIVLLNSGGAMVLTRVERGEPGDPDLFVLQDTNPQEHAPLVLDYAAFEACTTGQVILLKRNYKVRDEDRPFGLGWLVGKLLRDRRIVRDLAICAVALGLLSLVPIFIWRILIDQVLYNGGMATFATVGVGFILMLTFETAFGYLRRYLIIFMTTQLDMDLSIYIFNKALNLPIDFFERKPVGEIVHDMYEIWKLRGILAGSLFGTMFDGIVILIFLPVMLFFSLLLTACVLGLCALVCLWLIMMMPAVRRRVIAADRAEIAKSKLLVETVHGIRALKSLALGARQSREWDVRVARAAELRYEEGLIANLVQTVATPINGLMTTGVIAFAIYLTLASNELAYVGGLIYFLLLSNRVVAPLMQASQLVIQLDEARITVARIGSIANHPPEEGRSGAGSRVPLVGHIEFHEVTFRYFGTSVPALDRVSFNIPEGSVFGIVGRSGSGKTTVTRLLQLLHANYDGLIKIDGNDLRQIDLDHLRSSLGVVLQENFLFSGSIRDTIAAAKPDASFEEIVQAARLAGAEEFIERLPAGYETHIQEGSTNLSGGQKQRLAIARALIGNPRILILDEATSALDADSEAIVNANLLRIAEGRTLIVISHRLSSLVAADAILVLERGKVYDIGRHEELLERCDIYSGLWHQQHRHLLPRATNEIIILHAASAS